MNNNKVQQIFRKDYFPFVILLISTIVLHILININFGDEVEYFSKVLNQMSMMEFLNMRYKEWSSRLIIEGVLVFILQFSTICWKLINIGVIMLLAYSISYLTVNTYKCECNYFICGSILIYPLIDMASAGWVATTTNYLWCLSLGLYTLISVKKTINNNKIYWYEYLFYISFLFYATNQEQMCVLLLVTYLITNIYLIVNRKFNLFILLEFIVCIFSLAFHLTTPGNKMRLYSEATTWMPNFFTKSIIDKFYLGFTSTMSVLINSANFVFALFALVIFICVCKKFLKKGKILYIIVSSIPFLSVCILGILNKIIRYIFPNNYISLYFEKIFIPKEITLLNCYNISTYIPFVFFVLILGFVIVSIYWIFENSIYTFIVLLTFIVGLACRVVLGFSPTLYVSAGRTYIYTYFMFIICSVYILPIILEKLSKQETKFFWFTFFILTFVCYLRTIYQTYWISVNYTI